jgi:lysophospholipase L1-like esterase
VKHSSLARKWLIGGVVVVCSTVVSFLVVEQAYRCFLFGSAAFSMAKMNSLRPLGVSGLTQISPDGEMLYELRPDIATTFKLVPFHTNSRGLRDREYSVAKPANTFRIAVIGDSFVMGAGVRVEDTWHSILERELSESEGRSVEFINFGVGGYGLRQYLAVMRSKASTYHPDLFIVGFCADNNMFDRPESNYKTGYRPKPVAPGPFLQSFVLANAFSSMPLSLGGLARTGLQDPELGPGGMEYLGEQFTRIKASSLEVGTPVVIAYLGLQDGPVAEVSRAAKEASLAFVDASERFHGLDVRRYRLNRLDAHPNAAANRLFAEAIGDYVRQALRRLPAVPQPSPS